MGRILTLRACFLIVTNVVILSIVLSLQFTLETQRHFREATADAINVYCEDNDCLVSYPEARTR